MVLLTMTPALVEALEKLQSIPQDCKAPKEDEGNPQFSDTEPSLSEPKVGNPISHGQVLDIHRQLKKQGASFYHLEYLLKGSKVYIPPPPPIPKPTPEYKALMARLRAAEESRTYSRLLKPSVEPLHTSQPTAAHAFTSTQNFDNFDTSTSEELAVLFKDLNRQMMVVFNVLLSTVACAAAIWMAAKWWSTPARLALSMGGGLLVGVAEVVVYFGYVKRLEEATGKERKVKEVREIVKTWVVGGEEEKEQSLVGRAKSKEDSGIRSRIPRELEDT